MDCDLWFLTCKLIGFLGLLISMTTKIFMITAVVYYIYMVLSKQKLARCIAREGGDKMSDRGKISESFDEILFSSKFDSGNLDRVEECRSTLGPGTREFNLWTAPDCAGLPYESGCKSWFYFSVTTPSDSSGLVLRLNVQNLNKQCRLYQQGCTPFVRTVPGRGGWERLRDKVEYEASEEGVYVLSYNLTVPDSRKMTFYCAFCFPHSYTDCQKLLSKLDEQYRGVAQHSDEDSVYYHRELVCWSLEGRRVDLVTVSSCHGLGREREPRLDRLFPDTATERAHTFSEKKVIFVSSRVHPGETPSSHVFNGLLQFILRIDDPRAVTLRRHFVFKLIPMLNPDGVSRGHYRMNTTGVNLNRVYLDPDFEQYPSIFAARSLIVHHHQTTGDKSPSSASTLPNIINKDLPKMATASATTSEGQSTQSTISEHSVTLKSHSATSVSNQTSTSDLRVYASHSAPCHQVSASSPSTLPTPPQDAISVTKNSGLAFYVDLHAHASKRGCFFYGNYFSDLGEQTENMLFPRLVALNSPHLDFEQCVFSEKNMYTSDKRDGMSKEGSGRVAMYKATGHIHSYTLECNYNSGRQVNSMSEATLAEGRATPPHPGSNMPHRFSIQDFEQVGHALAIAALDLYQLNPWTRLPHTDYKSLAGLRESLQQRIRTTRAKRDKPLSARRVGRTPAVAASVSAPSVAKDNAQATKLVMKNQRTLGLSKGPASVSYDIAFVTEGKRSSRRKLHPPKVGKGRGKQRAHTQPPVQPELSTPSAVKPSVQDVVFPLHNLKIDTDLGPGIRVNGSPLPIEVSGTRCCTNRFSTSSSLRAKPCMGKGLQRAKTEPLPAINVTKHKINLVASSKTMVKQYRANSLPPSNGTKILGDSGKCSVEEQATTDVAETS